MKITPHNLTCPSCYETGIIETRPDNTIKWFTDTIYFVEVEGHSVPVCKKCSALMVDNEYNDNEF